jgi:hypothetical protein
LHKRQNFGPWRYFEVSSTDLLCIPSDWWHEVVNDGPTIGLTRNFASPDISEHVVRAATDRMYSQAVHVRPYIRYRFGWWENVCEHCRSYPGHLCLF